MNQLSVELTKIEANACIVQGYLDLYTQFNKVICMLKESGLSQEEIEKFIDERTKAAMLLLQAYKY